MNQAYQTYVLNGELMYEYFEGIIQAVTPAYIVIDVHGIGFRLLVANPYHLDRKSVV